MVQHLQFQLCAILTSIPFAAAFLPPCNTQRTFIGSTSSTSSPSKLPMIIDPNDLHMLNLQHHEEALTSVLSTMVSTTAGSLQPMNTDVDASAINSIKDYFIPTTSEEATRKALEAFVQTKQQAASTGAALVNSADSIQVDSFMPGAKGGLSPSATTSAAAAGKTLTISPEISKRELNWIAQQSDIYMRKIPFAVTLYALLDFFVLPNSQDVMSDELDDDRMAVASDWVQRAALRLGVLFSIVMFIIFIENMTYNPVL